MPSPRSTVLAGFVVSTIVVTVASAREGKWEPRRYFGVAGLALLSSLIADARPKLGASFAALYTTAVILRYGLDAFGGVEAVAQQGSSLRLDLPRGPKVDTTSTTTDEPGSSSTPAPDRPPLAGDLKVIGTPYNGTHTRGDWQSDNAVDIAMPVGTPLFATVDAEVVKVHRSTDNEASPLAGWQVTMRGSGGLSLFYTHLRTVNVGPGQAVRRGDIIGSSGAANNVPHLHFSVSPPFDPYRYVAGAVRKEQ